MFELHHTDIDGVACYWVATGRPTLAAQLIFRQGVADEPVHERGWLHLLEHAALEGRGGGALQVNGSVSLLHTAFDAHGPRDAVVDHLGHLVDWLSRPSLHDLEHEREVLRAEAALRGGPVVRALGWRYGAQGPGTLSQGEPGLGRAAAEPLVARAARVFTRQNAVLVLDGPPPPGLRLSLPEGSLLPPAQARPLEQPTPAAYVDEGGPVLSGTVGRSLAATIAVEILQRALHDRLRATGGAYAPWATYERVDRTRAVLLGGSDVLPERLPDLVDTLLSMCTAIDTEDVPGPWLSEVLQARLQGMNDPLFGPALAVRAAHDHLDETTVHSHDELLAELHAVDGPAVRDSLREFTGSLLLGVPGKTTWNDQLPMLRYPIAPARAEGRTYRSADWPADEGTLTVGADRVELRVGAAAQAVRFDDLAGMLTRADGSRHLIRRDGWALFVQPSAWRQGHRAVAALDAGVPAYLHLPQPPDPGLGATRMPAARRWWLGFRRLLRSVAALWIFLLAMVTVCIAGLATSNGLLIGCGGFVAATAYRELKARRARPDIAYDET
ncbi:hypothetical protein [Nocardioides rubriscoriae]|uniref:hypothetical protein n=1 Tax=Nocardioides rubriscoriae TaxID=642762 RepID=UPI0011E02FE0|nr:hypothetical protein [Nocardioides rubriscoriae]